MDETTSPALEDLDESFKLGSDIEDIPPLEEVGDHRKQTINYFGNSYQVWYTNNLWATFGLWWRATHPDEYTLHDFDLELKERRLDAMNFDEIMIKLKSAYPKLFNVLVELTDENEGRKERERQLKAEGKLPTGVYTREQIESGNFGHTPEQEAALEEISLPRGYGEEQLYYFSKAFEAMVPIAKDIDPAYDIYQFTI